MKEEFELPLRWNAAFAASFAFLLLSILFRSFSSFLLSLLILDRIIFATVAVGIFGIELTTLIVVLLYLRFGFGGVAIFALLLAPAFDLLKVVLFGGDPPNPAWVIKSLPYWLLIGLFAELLRMLPPLFAFPLIALSKNIIFNAQEWIIKRSLNPLVPIGNIAFSFFIGSLLQQKFIWLFS